MRIHARDSECTYFTSNNWKPIWMHLWREDLNQNKQKMQRRPWPAGSYIWNLIGWNTSDSDGFDWLNWWVPKVSDCATCTFKRQWFHPPGAFVEGKGLEDLEDDYVKESEGWLDQDDPQVSLRNCPSL